MEQVLLWVWIAENFPVGSPPLHPVRGMQQEFIVTPTQPTTLHRCTQQSTPKNSQRADDRCAFFTIRASLDEHILGLPPWVFCRICRKKLFFWNSNTPMAKCDHWYQNVWPLKNNSNSRLSDWVVFFFFLRKAHKQKRFPIYRCRRGREIEGNKRVQSLAWKLKKFIQWLLFTSLTNMMTLRGQPTTLISGS